MASEWKVRWLGGWIPLLLVTAGIVRGAVLPPDEIPGFLAGFSDKLIHGLEFGVLTLAAYQAFRLVRSGRLFRFRHGAALLYSLFFAVLTEVLQCGVPGRSASFSDFAADAAGIGLALALLFLIGAGVQDPGSRRSRSCKT